MGVLNRIVGVRASYSGGSFLLEEPIPSGGGDKIWIISGEFYPAEVGNLMGNSLTAVGDIPQLSEGEEVQIGYLIELKAPQSLQWEISDIEAAGGRNQRGRSFRDRLAVKRSLSCTWSAVSDEEMSVLLGMMQDVFFYLEYPDALTGAKKAGEFYVGNRSTPMLMHREDGSWMWQSLSASFTER